jgi:hypothetical protein
MNLSPEEANQRIVKRVLARIEKVVNKKLKSPCWIWQGSTQGKCEATPDGYPVFKVGKERTAVRRRLYTILTGNEIRDKALDSKCACSLCVNPAHMVISNRRKGGTLPS